MSGYLPAEQLLLLLGSIRRCRTLSEAKKVHTQIIRFASHTLVGNNLVQMYGSCGSVADARVVFDEIAARNAFSWNILISAHCQNGLVDLARDIFDRMPRRDVVSFNTISAALAHVGRVDSARAVFDHTPERDGVSWNGLITAYAKYGYLEQANSALEKCPQFHLVSCTGIMTAFLQCGKLRDAEGMFELMPDQDVVACTAMLTAYAELRHLRKARAVFDGMSSRDSTTWTAMLVAYANSGDVGVARVVFDRIPVPDSVSYNAMITAYVQHDQLDNAQAVFDCMPEANEISWTCMLSAYARLGDINRAEEIFRGMPVKDVVSWNAMIAAYTRKGLPWQAVTLFKRMTLVEGTWPVAETFLVTIDACSEAPAPLEGSLIHDELLESSTAISDGAGNALVSMYGRLGDVKRAREVFDGMRCPNGVSWSAMISAYAQNGHSRDAMWVFREMMAAGVDPDGVTLINVLAACSHSGLVEEGVQMFTCMSSGFEVQPNASHFVCLIDLLARAGRVDLAEELASRMPCGSGMAWMSVAGGCRSQGDVQGGETAVGFAVEHEPDRSAAGFLLLNQMRAGF